MSWLKRLRTWVQSEIGPDELSSEQIAMEMSNRRGSQPAVPEPPRPYSATDVQKIRERLHLSQTGFAQLLHVSVKTVQSWEQGVRVPSQAAERLLQFIEQPELLDEVAALRS